MKTGGLPAKVEQFPVHSSLFKICVKRTGLAFDPSFFIHTSDETWTYGGGSDKNGPDGFGTAADLGLDRLFVICSENTASAAEIVINSLKGIGFEVHTYGSTTEGKNVGMVTSQITYGSRVFEFAPINYYVMNAKDFYDYPDGFKVDHEVNNQNSIISTNRFQEIADEKRIRPLRKLHLQ